ncbi:hypothetical protein QBC32DRAFT_350706 [Pseudoneurospora amorphoporcata]|uniref:Uncharacterized protein n=1 Tax=Pseudoneurospora amorphoporcata TaxID=241081 RepID=A0AAN6SCQ1_9PEZI|nr:hypothetical protein QBC32DRAFT_350706 [Pseudoneurospora amorphoporcata]
MPPKADRANNIQYVTICPFRFFCSSVVHVSGIQSSRRPHGPKCISSQCRLWSFSHITATGPLIRLSTSLLCSLETGSRLDSGQTRYRLQTTSMPTSLICLFVRSFVSSLKLHTGYQRPEDEQQRHATRQQQRRPAIRITRVYRNTFSTPCGLAKLTVKQHVYMSGYGFVVSLDHGITSDNPQGMNELRRETCNSQTRVYEPPFRSLMRGNCRRVSYFYRECESLRCCRRWR